MRPRLIACIRVVVSVLLNSILPHSNVFNSSQTAERLLVIKSNGRKAALGIPPMDPFGIDLKHSTAGKELELWVWRWLELTSKANDSKKKLRAAFVLTKKMETLSRFCRPIGDNRE